MVIETIEIKNFRNYKYLKTELSKETNILFGDNAQGKTNFLEAIYLCGLGKSHRGNKETELIFFDKEEAHIKLIGRKKGVPLRIDVHLKKNKKKGIAINGVPLKKTSDVFGILNIVIFSPEDLDIIKRSPMERRKFMDIELCQIDKIYVKELIRYNKILAGRNKFLKETEINEKSRMTLEVLNTQLIETGKKIISRRKKFVLLLNEIAKEIHKEITEGKENIDIIYEPNVEENDFEKQIEKNQEREIRQRITLTGPHRDDIGIYIKEKDIRKYGSQGQQRTCALSLKLSEIEMIKKEKKDDPVLLLDDVFSELDKDRQKQLLYVLKSCQTIITSTGTEDIIQRENFLNNKYFKVEKGTFALERS